VVVAVQGACCQNRIHSSGRERHLTLVDETRCSGSGCGNVFFERAEGLS